MALETALVTDDFTPQMRVFFEEYLKALTDVYANQHAPEIAWKLAEQAVVEYEGAWILVKLTGNYQYLQDVLQRALERFDS
jgi:TetR/AcrR family transcriptional repressor of nem operon